MSNFWSARVNEHLSSNCRVLTFKITLAKPTFSDFIVVDIFHIIGKNACPILRVKIVALDISQQIRCDNYRPRMCSNTIQNIGKTAVKKKKLHFPKFNFRPWKMACKMRFSVQCFSPWIFHLCDKWCGSSNLLYHHDGVVREGKNSAFFCCVYTISYVRSFRDWHHKRAGRG